MKLIKLIISFLMMTILSVFNMLSIISLIFYDIYINFNTKKL